MLAVCFNREAPGAPGPLLPSSKCFDLSKVLGEGGGIGWGGVEGWGENADNCN